MLKVKLSIPDPIWPILRQTPGSKGIWDNCQFYVNDEYEEYDYWIVYENLRIKESVRCPKENTILVTAEPPGVKHYDTKFIRQFGTIITFRDDINHPNIIRSQPGLPWMVGGRYIKESHSWEASFKKDYDELSKINSYNKTKLISIILSKKTFSEGHRKRDYFVSLVKKEFGDEIDIYGIGYNEIKDKWDGIAPYKYYLALENSTHKDYWTEKISDCFLAGAYPIYYGCPNITDYFHSESLSIIDIEKPLDSIRAIKEILYSNKYESSIEKRIESKAKILNIYNLFPEMASIIMNLRKSPYSQSKITSTTLLPETPNKMILILMKRISKKVIKKTISIFHKLKGYKKVSYSQCGEDLIIRFIFDLIGIKKPTYIDIGAHHPKFINNTALFYIKGSRGINIEPNPYLFKSFSTKRRKDKNLNIGIADEKGELSFYIIDPPTLSTFSNEEAKTLVNEGSFRLKETITISVDTIQNVLDETNNGVFPDLLSIDIEGFELHVLNQIDFEQNFPKVICIETLSSNTLLKSSIDSLEKDDEIIDYLLDNGYKIYADTSINTIFIKEGIL